MPASPTSSPSLLSSMALTGLAALVLALVVLVSVKGAVKPAAGAPTVTPHEVAAVAAPPLTSALPAALAGGSAPAPGQLASSATEPTDAGADQAPPRRAYSVAAIGDSLTDERSYAHSYVAQLRAACPKSRFDNHGVGGNMANQMRRRFRQDVLGEGGAPRPSYTHLIVFGGVNDLYSDLTAGRTPQKVANDLRQMYAWGHEAGMRVVAITVTPWGGFKRFYNARRGKATQELNAWIQRQPAAGRVDAVIDGFGLLSCGDAERLCPRLAEPFKDGIHFGKAGHAVLTEALLERVFPDCA